MQTFGRTGITSFLTRKEPGQEDAGVVEDDIKKVSHYFINTLHHNTGYFLMVNLTRRKIEKSSLFVKLFSLSSASFSTCS